MLRDRCNRYLVLCFLCLVTDLLETFAEGLILGLLRLMRVEFKMFSLGVEGLLFCVLFVLRFTGFSSFGWVGIWYWRVLLIDCLWLGL